ncbi:MAG: HNH nuclease, partial [Mycobacterium sp.]
MDPFTARSQVLEALAAVDAAQAVLRSTSTDLVGNAFRIAVAERLETQSRVTLGLTYRMFGEIADPPDGLDDPDLPAGIKVADVLRTRLRITAGATCNTGPISAAVRTNPLINANPASPSGSAAARSNASTVRW